MNTFTPRLGDCRVVLKDYVEGTFDVCITDPPYGIGFMGKEWDTFRPGVETARVVSPRESANPNVAGRSRSPASSPSAVEYDRTLTGQRAFQEWTESWAREVYRVIKPGAHLLVFGAPRSHHRMMSGLEDAGFEIRDCCMWLFGQGFPKSKNLGDGWGTALKPAWEPIAVARKPVPRTIIANHALHGTGGINIEGCRVPAPPGDRVDYGLEGNEDAERFRNTYQSWDATRTPYKRPEGGRWPSNLLIDEVAAALVGPQSRFFYCPKVSTREREFGCERLPARSAGDMTGGRKEGSDGLNSPRAGAGRLSGAHNAHPTVKPIELMRWLVRLATPPGGVVLDPFIGSGPTAIAASLEGHDCVGIDQEPEWLIVAESRVHAWQNLPTSETRTA
jgi:DNA modification methylase